MKNKVRVFSFLLALAILISSSYCISVFSLASGSPASWDGATKTQPSEGSGTETSPYLISTAEEFAYVMSNDKNSAFNGKYYKLTADIYLNDITKINWATGEAESGYTPNTWTPNTQFYGTIDGSGHKVYGLYINTDPGSYSEKNSGGSTVGYGLIGKNYSGKVVKFNNFGMDYIFIHAAHEVSPFVALLNSSGEINFDSCFLGENVWLEGYDVGGFVGYGSYRTKIYIKNSCVITPLENITTHGKKTYGAFLGDVFNYSGGNAVADIQYDFCIGKLFANNVPHSTNYSYATVNQKDGWGTIISADNMKGLDVFTNAGKMPKLNKEKFTATEGYPQLLVFANVDKIRVSYHDTAESTEDLYVYADQLISELKTPAHLNQKFMGFYYDPAYTQPAQPTDIVSEHADLYGKWEALDLESAIWNGAEKEPVSDDDGDGYIDIRYPSELAWVISNNGNKKYEFLNDLVLNDISVEPVSKTYHNHAQEEPLEWYIKEDKAFSGEINGNGHVVYGLFYNGKIESGKAAGLIPSLNKAVIQNVGIEDAYIVGDSEYRIGALAGTLQGSDQVTIEQCYVGSSVYVAGNQKIGGLTGGGAPANKNKTVRATIRNCYSLAEVDAKNSGGIVGNLWSKYSRYDITGCYSNSTFSYGTDDLGNSTGNYAVQDKGGSYWTNISPEKMLGADAEINMSNLDFESVYMTTTGYPQLRVFYDYVVTLQVNSEPPVSIGAFEDTKISDLQKPERFGYQFAGFYKDAAFTQKAGEEEFVKNYTALFAKLEQVTAGDTVYNTYDQEGAVFTKFEQSDKRDYQVDGKFVASKSNLTAAAENGQFSQYDAWVEPGAGVNGSNGLKVVRAHGYEKRWPTAVMLYDFDGSSLQPKANSFYQISLKYKLTSLKSGKQLKFRLRELVDGKINVLYEDVSEYGVINERRIDYNAVSDSWVSAEFKFATKDNPQALYLAITTENSKYWAEELELVIDDIAIKEITEEEKNASYISPDSLNTYDDKGVTFTKATQTDKRDYQVEGKFESSMSSMGIGTEKGLFSQYDAWVEEGAGVNGSNAVKAVRAHGYEKQWPTAVCLYDSNLKEFTPKANSYYKITLQYRIAGIKKGKKIQLRLRSEVGGKYNVKHDEVNEYGVINKRDINHYTVSGKNWVEASMNFATADNPEPLFLAITTENNKYWAEELELYIDNIEIKGITKEEMDAPYVSPNSVNTYDESGLYFTRVTQNDKRDYQVEGKFESSMSSMGIGTEKGVFAQYDAWVESGADRNGGNALKIVRAHGFKKQWPTAVCLYDSNFNEFMPRANSFYQIKLKYKLVSLKKGKQIEIRLRQEVGGKYNVKYEKVVDYGRVNSKIINYTNVSDAWMETTFRFSTGSDVEPLYLAFTTENQKYWAEELEMYMDDISIKEITYADMGFDEGAKGKVWSGKIAMRYAGGDGTEDDPYLIETPEQLAKCVNDADPEMKYYKVTADLKLNDTSSENWTKNAKEWIYDTQNEKFFRGHIDGNGHVVSGLYYDSRRGEIQYAALFPQVKGEAVIEKLGITRSSITVKDGQKEAYGAAFIALVPSFKVNGKGTGPTIRQCFADDTVSVDSYFAGGLICGMASYGPVTLEDCYFAGKLFGSSRSGTLFGNSWTDSANFSSIKNCYATSPDRNQLISNKGLKATNFENVYADSKADNPRPTGVAYSILKFMQGNYAKELMQGFDFDRVWKVVEGGTPVLRVFGSDQYSSFRKTEDVEIRFITNGGSSCEPILGQPRSELPDLPTPTRYGYEFAGWYYFFDMYLPCDLEIFPDFNTVLYAKWVSKGFEIDFENNLDGKYDYNTAAIQHKPGTAGYLPKFNRNGMKSMHCLADEEVSPVFLLSYENAVEKGKGYEIVLRMKTDSSEKVSGEVELLFSQYPDISSELIQTKSTIAFSDVGSNTWKEIKATFIAADEFVFIKTPKNTSLFFDDIQVVPTGKTGKISVFSPASSSSFNPVIWIVAGVLGVLLIGGGAAAIVLRLKKKRVR